MLRHRLTWTCTYSPCGIILLNKLAYKVPRKSTAGPCESRRGPNRKGTPIISAARFANYHNWLTLNYG